MSRTYGHRHTWFAWRPVNTNDHGWQWLRTLRRRRIFVDISGHPPFRYWEYTLPTPEESL